MTITTPERQLEKALIAKLRDLKYEYRSDIRDRATLEQNFRRHFEALIRTLSPQGNTALLDAVWEAHQQLLALNDTEAINAIVVMTDGLENASRRTELELQRAFARSESEQIVVFTIGFGANPDTKLLQQLAVIGGGQFRRADEMDIEELYRTISTYF